MLINCTLPIVLDSPAVVESIMGRLDKNEEGFDSPSSPIGDSDMVDTLLNLIGVHGIASRDELAKLISPEIANAIGLHYQTNWEEFVFKLTYWQLITSIELLGFIVESLDKWELGDGELFLTFKCAHDGESDRRHSIKKD